MLKRSILKEIILLLLLITAAVGVRASSFFLPQAADTAKPGKKQVLDSKIDYHARDSIRFDVANQKVYLFGEARVDYEDTKLKAAFIEFNMKDNIVFAEGVLDSTGKEIGQPEFEEAGKKFTAKKMRYNFETKKGKINDVITKEGEGYIHGSVVAKDSSDVYYIKRGLYTTCDNKVPHFCIAANKLKIIPDDKIITGPAYMEIMGIPTPLAVPFGLFPNKKGRASGILMPAYGESERWGFFLKDGGYYFGFSDYFDLALRSDIYSRGSWGTKVSSSYNRRYRFNGNVNANYAVFYEGDPELPNSVQQKQFFVRWNHTQDARLHPGSRFSANVNAGSSSYNRYNSNNLNDFFSSTFQSNIAWTKLWSTRIPMNLSVNARHSQNTISKQVDLSVPDITFGVSRISASGFRKTGKQRWYDKFGLSWTSYARNDISTADSLLFTEKTLDKLKYGIKHSVPVSGSWGNKFGSWNLSFSPSLTNYFNSIEKTYNADSNKVFIDTIRKHAAVYEYSFSTSLNTRIYGMFQFKGKRLKAIRHVISPSTGFSFRPDFSESNYGYYKSVQKDVLGNEEVYPIYQNGIFGYPGSGKSGLVNLSLNNILEAKVRSRKDTSNTDRKVSLIEGLSVSSSYNIMADHFNWSLVSVNGRTTLFKNLGITFSGTIDPYITDSLGKRLERFEWNVNKRPGRLTSGSVSLNTSIRPVEKKKKQSSKGTQQELDFINANPDAFIDFSIPWSLNLYYNIYYTKGILLNRAGIPVDSIRYTQSLTFNGDVRITKNWKMSFTSGYDYISKEFTTTSLNIHRDLHCWEFVASWIPFGFRQSYSIDIRVKSSVLQDLKLSRRRDWQDYRQ